MDDAAFLAAFEAREYPYDMWDHRAHIRMAYLYLSALPFAQALDAIRAGIQAYNRAKQVPESQTRGYHETLTVAWARLVFGAIEQEAEAGREAELGSSAKGDPAGSEAFCDRHSELLDVGRLDRHYSSGRLWSAEAKRRLVEPDLAPLPG